MLRWLLAIALVGCGHIGFEPVAGGDAGAPGDATGPQGWDLVQTAGSENSAVTVKRLGAHHLVVVAVEVDGNGLVTAITDSSNCNAYVAIPTAHATCAACQINLQIFYARDSCPDADQISVATTTSADSVVVWEVSGIRTDVPVDTVAVLNDQLASTTPLGPKITTSAAGEFVVAVAIVDNSVTRIHAGNEFTNDQTSDDNGWAHLTDPQAPAGTYQAQWDQPRSGAYCASAAAFKVGP